MYLVNADLAHEDAIEMKFKLDRRILAVLNDWFQSVFFTCRVKEP